MKRKLVASILGLAASVAVVASSHAQGHIIFENYGNSTLAPVNYGVNAGGPVGTGVNSTFTAGLYYFLGTAADATSNLMPPGSFEFNSVTTQFNTGPAAGPGGVGLFSGPTINIADYVSGPITFEVIAYNGADYTTSSVRGHSTAFTLPSIATGQSPGGEFGPGFTSFTVTPVPEPTVFALAGIGAAALMVVRRKK